MSNSKSIAPKRKHTASTDAKRESIMDEGVTIIVDGVSHTIRFGDLTAMDTRLLRREVGMSFVGLIQAAEEDPDIDIIAALMWLARRTHGEPFLKFQEVASEVDYSVSIETEVAGGSSEDDDPEA